MQRGDARVTEVTQMLSQIEHGDPSAAERLLPLVYDELRKLATAKLAQEKRSQTLQATALVHDAYIRLVDVEQAQQWHSRGHFFAAAAEAMRRILVEAARKRQRAKHGGLHTRVELLEDIASGSSSDQLTLAIHDALDDLAAQNPQAAALVKIRYFAGMTLPQAAEASGVSARTADRLWAYAKAWLHAKLHEDEEGS